jgi:regulator of protease activity HflC (stomatin/prohibitin superfamily)
MGRNYQTDLVLPVFRSAAADVTAQYAAKDMHSGQRRAIEAEIGGRMNEHLEPRGIHVDAVLMKSISLPPGLYGAIEQRLEAEQDAARMQFILEQERMEAERLRIEAEGIRDSQRILEEGLTPRILQWRSIEAFQELANSPGSRVIVTDGSLPFLVDPLPPEAPME